MLDSFDCKIITQLMHYGRTTWAELGNLLGLSSPAAADRVRKLEEAGVIQGYCARINPEAVGCSLTSFISVTLDRPEHRQLFLSVMETLPQITECYHTTGDEDYFLKVRCQDTKELETIISTHLKNIPGIIRTRTTVVLHTVKETSILPISLKGR